jgi:hypothetical protein
MDSFEVIAQSADVLSTSILVENMQTANDRFPYCSLVWDGYAYSFDDIDGGFVDDGEYHLVNLITANEHTLHDISQQTPELHVGEDLWELYVDEYYQLYNDGVYTLSLAVSEYRYFTHSFAIPLHEHADKRQTRHYY